MLVSEKWGETQIIHSMKGIFPYRPSILGYPHLWNHPYQEWIIDIIPSMGIEWIWYNLIWSKWIDNYIYIYIIYNPINGHMMDIRGYDFVINNIVWIQHDFEPCLSINNRDIRDVFDSVLMDFSRISDWSLQSLPIQSADRDGYFEILEVSMAMGVPPVIIYWWIVHEINHPAIGIPHPGHANPIHMVYIYIIYIYNI